jgi:hypothetical protein
MNRLRWTLTVLLLGLAGLLLFEHQQLLDSRRDNTSLRLRKRQAPEQFPAPGQTMARFVSDNCADLRQPSNRGTPKPVPAVDMFRPSIFTLSKSSQTRQAWTKLTFQIVPGRPIPIGAALKTPSQTPVSTGILSQLHPFFIAHF